MTWQNAARAIWRYKWLAAALTALLVIATVLIVGAQTPQYEATTTVRIKQVLQDGQGPDLETAQRNAGSYSVLVGGSEFAALVVGELQGRAPGLTPDGVQFSVGAEPVPSTDLIRIAVRNESPETAALIANAAAPALRALARQGGGTERIQLSDAARVPGTPVAPRLRLAIAVALVVGLVVNGALMILLDLLRDRYRGPDELRETTGRPVLAAIPRFAPTSFAGRSQAAAETAPEPRATARKADPKGSR